MQSQPQTTKSLEIASLGISPKDENYLDAIHCVAAYWEHAPYLTAEEAEKMYDCITRKEWIKSDSARYSPTDHPLYIKAKGDGSFHPDDLSLAVFIILNTIYPFLLDTKYTKAIRKRFQSKLTADLTNLPDHLEDYLSLYAETTVVDTDDDISSDGGEDTPNSFKDVIGVENDTQTDDDHDVNSNDDTLLDENDEVDETDESDDTNEANLPHNGVEDTDVTERTGATTPREASHPFE